MLWEDNDDDSSERGDGCWVRLESCGTLMPLPTCTLFLPPLLVVLDSLAPEISIVANQTRASAPCESSWREDALSMSSGGGGGPYHAFDSAVMDIVILVMDIVSSHFTFSLPFNN